MPSVIHKKSTMNQRCDLLGGRPKHLPGNLLRWLGVGAWLVGGALAVEAQPANDSFANRTVLAETNVTVSGSLAGATSEAGEPFFEGVSTGQTAWWTWTAPSNGIVTLSASGQGFSPLLGIYTGTDLASLSLVASNRYLSCFQYCGCHWLARNQTTFHVARGQVYQLAVDVALMTDPYWNGDLVAVPVMTNSENHALSWGPVWMTNVPPGAGVFLQWQLTPAPPNDDFEQRTKLVGARLHFPASNAGATRQANEPFHLGNPGGSSVWYSWTALASGRVTLSTNAPPVYLPPTTYGFELIGASQIKQIFHWGWTCGDETEPTPPPTFAAVFAAYTGNTLETLTNAGCWSQGLPDGSTATAFEAVKGQTYQIAFDGSMGTTSDLTLWLALTRPASNDRFGNRMRLRGIYAGAHSYNAGASHQRGEPMPTGSTRDQTVWWTWTAPVSGPVEIGLGGSDFAFPVSMYTGASLVTLNEVAHGLNSATFEAVAGKTYQIAVSDAAGQTGNITLTLVAPTVEVSLVKTTRLGTGALLRFATAPGQKLLLLNSNDGENWRNGPSVVARRNTVDFLVYRAPKATGPHYRAIIVDRLFWPRR